VNTPPQLRDVDRYNRRFYERCWRAASLLAMPGVWPPAKVEGLQVEIGCGLRPRLPLSEALFVDVSRRPARSYGAPARASSVRASTRCRSPRVPYRSCTCFDILEHVSDDVGVGRGSG
jgi:hypothetical protein